MELLPWSLQAGAFQVECFSHGFELWATHEAWEPWGASLEARGSSEDEHGHERGTVQHKPHSAHG